MLAAACSLTSVTRETKAKDLLSLGIWGQPGQPGKRPQLIITTTTIIIMLAVLGSYWLLVLLTVFLFNLLSYLICFFWSNQLSSLCLFPVFVFGKECCFYTWLFIASSKGMKVFPYTVMHHHAGSVPRSELLDDFIVQTSQRALTET